MHKTCQAFGRRAVWEAYLKIQSSSYNFFKRVRFQKWFDQTKALAKIFHLAKKALYIFFLVTSAWTCQTVSSLKVAPKGIIHVLFWPVCAWGPLRRVLLIPTYIETDIDFVRFWNGKLIGMLCLPSIIVFHLPSASTNNAYPPSDDINYGPPLAIRWNQNKTLKDGN